jgi:CheY-like chemotaxis protein
VPVKKTTSIAELLKESATFALRGSDIRCEFHPADDLWPVIIDEGQIGQVITNLVINAHEAMPAGGILRIGARNIAVQRADTLPLSKGNYIEVTVADSGFGVPKEHLGRIFDPFFTTKQRGSGLGLASAYSIVKNHDGYITVESELGAGTTFHIYLPASGKPASRKRGVEAAQAALPGKGRILVMDDEEMIREMMGSMLSSRGYEVELTGDGTEAIERYVQARGAGEPFDAVILDLTVPGGMGGKETIKKLGEIDPGVTAIVSSGYATDPIMSEFKKHGFSAVVTKPYNAEELENTLYRILRRRK